MAKNTRSMLEKIEDEILELKDVMAEMKKENVEMKEKIEGNQTFKRKMGINLFCIPNAKKFSIRRALPAELLSELFASLPLEKAFGILAKMPNGLLERNMRKMLKSIEMAMRNNKWNEADCGPKMAISEGGLVVKHSGPNYTSNRVRAQLAFPKFNLNFNKSTIAYFEVEILVKPDPYSWGIHIGFCTQQFLLEGKFLGNEQNSIGIWHKGGMYIDGEGNRFGNEGGLFQAGEVIGIGIVHFPANSSMKCFASCNGQLLGKVDLPMKFADLELFPAVSMCLQNELIRANFGQNEWRYNPPEIVDNL